MKREDHKRTIAPSEIGAILNTVLARLSNNPQDADAWAVIAQQLGTAYRQALTIRNAHRV